MVNQSRHSMQSYGIQVRRNPKFQHHLLLVSYAWSHQCSTQVSLIIRLKFSEVSPFLWFLCPWTCQHSTSLLFPFYQVIVKCLQTHLPFSVWWCLFDQSLLSFLLLIFVQQHEGRLSLNWYELLSLPICLLWLGKTF